MLWCMQPHNTLQPHARLHTVPCNDAHSRMQWCTLPHATVHSPPGYHACSPMLKCIQPRVASIALQLPLVHSVWGLLHDIGLKPHQQLQFLCHTAGVKRKLAAVLGSPTGTSGGTLGAGPPQTGHAPLPLQSVVNGQNSNRDSQGVPARNSGGVLVSRSLSLESVNLCDASHDSCMSR